MNDVFLCHVSEDKEEIVFPLYEKLKSSNITCWFDAVEIKWGDSIIDKVNFGLKDSNYLIVVLSKSFIKKNWAFKELNSILNLEASDGKIRVLPLFCGTKEEIVEVRSSLPIINDKAFIVWDGSPDKIVSSLKMIQSQTEVRPLEDCHNHFKNKSNNSLFLNYGLIGLLCGVLFSISNIMNDPSSYDVFYVVIGVFISMIYGVFIKYFLSKRYPNYVPVRFWRNINLTGVKNILIPILPNVIAFPIMGGLLADYIYETYFATIIGMLLAFFFGVLLKFKLSSISSATIWMMFGMFFALQYSQDSDQTTPERLQSYGIVGAVLGAILAVFISMVLGAVKELMSKNGNEIDLIDFEE